MKKQTKRVTKNKAYRPFYRRDKNGTEINGNSPAANRLAMIDLIGSVVWKIGLLIIVYLSISKIPKCSPWTLKMLSQWWGTDP